MRFIDLQRQYRRIQDDVKAAIDRVLESSQFILGPEVEAFEEEIAAFVGVKHAVSCASGTDALMLALMAIGVGPGDEVIVPAFTFFATAEVVALLGAKPVFVDIEEDTYNVRVDQVEDAIGPKTKAVIAVSLYGQCAELMELKRLADERGIFLIEDAAQSLGAEHRGFKSCSIAHISATSFFPAKPLGCYGDGGCVFTNDDGIADRLRALRNHGQVKRYLHKYIGLNSRLDAVQAAILRVKLKIFPQEIELRQIAAGRYDSLLREKGIDPPMVRDYNLSVYAQYTVRVPNRDRVAEFLNANGIPTAVHYPVPVPYQEAFAGLGHAKGDFPVAERAAQEVLSLPFHPYINIEEQVKVVEALWEALNS